MTVPPLLGEARRGLLPAYFYEKALEFSYYAVDADDAERAVNLKMELRRKGKQLELVDAFTAVVALHYDLTLLTKDKDFLPVPGLKLENWLN